MYFVYFDFVSFNTSVFLSLSFLCFLLFLFSKLLYFQQKLEVSVISNYFICYFIILYAGAS